MVAPRPGWPGPRILATCDYRENVMIESKKEFYFFVGIGVMIIAAGAAVLTRFI